MSNDWVALGWDLGIEIGNIGAVPDLLEKESPFNDATQHLDGFISF